MTANPAWYTPSWQQILPQDSPYGLGQGHFIPDSYRLHFRDNKLVLDTEVPGHPVVLSRHARAFASDPSLQLRSLLRPQVDPLSPIPALPVKPKTSKWLSHAYVGLWTSAVVFLNWYALFVGLAKPGISSLSLLLLALPFEYTIVKILKKFMYELAEVWQYQKVFRPRWAKFLNWLGISDVAPAYSNTNGISSYERDALYTDLLLSTFMDECYQAKHAGADLNDSQLTAQQIKLKNELLTQLRAINAEDRGYLQDFQKRVEGLNIDFPDLPKKRRETPVMFRSLLQSESASVSPYLYTALGSGALALGASVFLWGVPLLSALGNTKSVLLVAALSSMLLGPVNSFIDESIVVPFYEYLSRNWLVKKMNSSPAVKKMLDKLSPSFHGILGLPQRERWRFNFDAAFKTARKKLVMRRLERLELRSRASGDVERLKDLDAMIEMLERDVVMVEEAWQNVDPSKKT